MELDNRWPEGRRRPLRAVPDYLATPVAAVWSHGPKTDFSGPISLPTLLRALETVVGEQRQDRQLQTTSNGFAPEPLPDFLSLARVESRLQPSQGGLDSCLDLPSTRLVQTCPRTIDHPHANRFQPLR